MDKVNKLLTVVVPVYKVEPYINKCLDSLLVPAGQLERLEVIVVNDGTPDRSAEMAREYEKRYPQTFRVIDKENGGHGSAWNRGLKEATGKYLRFLDSDDWFDTEALSGLMECLEHLDVDLVLSERVEYDALSDKYTQIPVTAPCEDDILPVEAFSWEGNTANVASFMHMTYRTDIIRNHVRFLEGIYYDDTILKIAPLIDAATVYVQRRPVYYYLLGRPGQTMSPSVIARHQRALLLARLQAVQYYLDRVDSVRDYGRKSFLHSIVCSMMIDSFVSLSDLPFSECRNLLSKWEVIYRQFAGRDMEVVHPRAVDVYLKYPFTVFYYLTRLSRRFGA